jgi:hypothetical protein
MRLRLVIAALVLSLGVLTLGARATAAQSMVTIPVGDLWFCSSSYEDGVCETVVDAGTTVVWDFSPADAPHTTTECGASCDSPTGSPLWNSGIISDGSSFQYTFTAPGTYLYYCQVHPQSMRGRIVVQTPTQQPTPTVQPGMTPTQDTDPDATTQPDAATPAQPSAIPSTGHGPTQSSTAHGWLWPMLLGISGALLLVLGAQHAYRAR